MQWDILGRKKLLEKIETLESEIRHNTKIYEHYDKKLNDLYDSIQEIKKFMSKEIAEIPVYDPKIRDAEKTYKEEKRKEEEYYTNFFRN